MPFHLMMAATEAFVSGVRGGRENSSAAAVLMNPREMLKNPPISK